MGKESKVRELRRKGVIAPVKTKPRNLKWLKILVLVVLVIAVLFSGLRIWGYVERDVAAKVGSETIKQSDVDSQLSYYVQMYSQYGIDLNSSQYASMKDNLAQSILNNMIEESLMVQYAKAHNITYDKATFDKNMQDQINQLITQGETNNGKDNFASLVDAQYGSMDAYKAHLTTVLTPYVERPLLKDAVLNEQYKSINITDADVKNYFNSTGQVDAEHFLVEVNTKTASKKDIANAKKIADDFYQSVIDEQKKLGNKFDFATLAKAKADELNKDKAKTGIEVARYESLGYFKKGSMVKPFEEACFDPNNKVGSIVGPIETEFGFHVIHILGKKPVSDNYDTPAQSNVRLVLIKFTAGDTKSEDAAKMSANSIAIQTKKNLSFTEAVKNFSQDDTTKAKNGETGFFTETDRPEIFAAAQKLKPGEIAGPIKTTGGYAVIQLIQNKPAVKASLSDKATFDKVKSDLEAEKKTEIETNFVNQLKKQYGVRTTNPWRSFAAFMNTHFGKQWSSFVAWWNSATGRTTTSTPSTTTTPSGTTPSQPLAPVSGS
ncbi:MAG: peptidylprolyl isomerase [Caldisericaceae bacterium]